MNRQCKLCTFFNPSKTWEGGTCHRYAPRPGKDAKAIWAVVEETNWCGEFFQDPSLGIHATKRKQR